MFHILLILAGIGPANILSSEYAICLAICLLADIEFLKFLKK